MWLFLPLAVVLALGLFHVGRNLLAWTLSGALLFVGWWITGVAYPPLFLALAGIFLLVAVVGGVPPLRRLLITRRILPLVSRMLPRMSETERTAIEAGTVWWEGELFSGDPDWKRLLNFHPQQLTAKEQAFLDGPCERVCGMLTDWEVNRAGDLPAEVWSYLRTEGFFGMIIPERFGGLGFSAVAHSAVTTKLSTRSAALAVTVMLPNSLGPAELLLHYGTDEQKKEYLPRLATGEEIPAFALTEPGAGSDAGSMQSHGVVCEGRFRGRKVLGMRLDWDKRYITLAPVATVLGLAFKLRDPDHLLGDKTELGISFALVPTNLPGVETGERHDPLGVAFLNGPTRGTGVFVPLDFIIGGREMAGQGWRMLMQTLAAGRGISLPSLACGGAMLAARASGAYATVRQQFGMPIGRFEGIMEPLARIAGTVYAMEGVRRMTAGAIGAGESPSVASALSKCYLTERMREVVSDAMDIAAGAGISLGPRNILAGTHLAFPIAITVEGANILTRSMILFGQGSVRCHPFMQEEMKGAHGGDLVGFDRAFFGHLGFVVQNMVRSLLLGATNGALAGAPVSGPAASLYGKVTRMSAAYAMAADFAMGTLGSSLKRKESITGRLADILASMYFSAGALKRFHDEGSKERDLPYLTWYVEHAMHEAQQAYLGVLRNLPNRPVAGLLRALAFPFGARCHPPSDALTREVALGMLEGHEPREHLTESMYLPPPEEPGLGNLEATLALVVEALPLRRRVFAAAREKRIERKPKETIFRRAFEAGVIDADELAQLEAADAARDETVSVDSFEEPPPTALSA
jgi:acyl-CoA dehydrogenase